MSIETMENVTRRRFVGGASALLGGSVAGCLGTNGGSDPEPTAQPNESPSPTPTPSEPEAVVRADGELRIDVAALTDRDVTVEDGRFRYTEPVEAEWALSGRYKGTQPDGTNPGMRFGPTLSGETPAVLVAPVYAEAGFEYHVFANVAFVERADWHVLALSTSEGADGSRPVAFERFAEGVFSDTVTADLVEGVSAETPLSVAVADVEFEDSLPEDTTFAWLEYADPRDPARRAPEAAFSFEYDASAESLTVRHVGGDTIPGESLVIATDERTIEGVSDGYLRAGDEFTVSVAADATVRVVWRAPSADTSATLAVWTGPEA